MTRAYLLATRMDPLDASPPDAPRRRLLPYAAPVGRRVPRRELCPEHPELLLECRGLGDERDAPRTRGAELGVPHGWHASSA